MICENETCKALMKYVSETDGAIFYKCPRCNRTDIQLKKEKKD